MLGFEVVIIFLMVIGVFCSCIFAIGGWKWKLKVVGFSTVIGSFLGSGRNAYYPNYFTLNIIIYYGKVGWVVGFFWIFWLFSRYQARCVLPKPLYANS